MIIALGRYEAITRPLTATEVERAYCINVVYRQPPAGVTYLSKEAFKRHHRRLGSVRRIVLAYVTEPGWNFLTYVIDTENRALCLDGFSWGYGGTGPTGLRWLLERLGFSEVDIGDAVSLPDHEEGVWELELRAA